MKTRIRFIRNLTMFWVAVSFFVQRAAFAQEDFEVTLARYKSTPAVFELAKMTRSYDPTVAVAAILLAAAPKVYDWYTSTPLPVTVAAFNERASKSFVGKHEPPHTSNDLNLARAS